jgi:hypothetical protein
MIQMVKSVRGMVVRR